MTDASQNQNISEQDTNLGTTFQQFHTTADDIVLHEIWDFQLNEIAQAVRPFCLSLSTTMGGAAIGLIPSILDVTGKLLGNKPIGILGGGTLAAFFACVTGALIYGFQARKGILAAEGFIAKMREKPRWIFRAPV